MVSLNTHINPKIICNHIPHVEYKYIVYWRSINRDETGKGFTYLHFWGGGE